MIYRQGVPIQRTPWEPITAGDLEYFWDGRIADNGVVGTFGVLTEMGCTDGAIAVFSDVEVSFLVPDST